MSLINYHQQAVIIAAFIKKLQQNHCEQRKGVVRTETHKKVVENAALQGAMGDPVSGITFP